MRTCSIAHVQQCVAPVLQAMSEQSMQPQQQAQPCVQQQQPMQFQQPEQQQSQQVTPALQHVPQQSDSHPPYQDPRKSLPEAQVQLPQQGVQQLQDLSTVQAIQQQLTTPSRSLGSLPQLTQQQLATTQRTVPQQTPGPQGIAGGQQEFQMPSMPSMPSIPGESLRPAMFLLMKWLACLSLRLT